LLALLSILGTSGERFFAEIPLGAGEIGKASPFSQL
jgi:hypothetical protein